ncbi:uncharacterized [Tachysurus ichikawai]
MPAALTAKHQYRVLLQRISTLVFRSRAVVIAQLAPSVARRLKGDTKSCHRKEVSSVSTRLSWQLANSVSQKPQGAQRKGQEEGLLPTCHLRTAVYGI